MQVWESWREEAEGWKAVWQDRRIKWNTVCGNKKKRSDLTRRGQTRRRTGGGGKLRGTRSRGRRREWGSTAGSNQQKRWAKRRVWFWWPDSTERTSRARLFSTTRAVSLKQTLISQGTSGRFYVRISVSSDILSKGAKISLILVKHALQRESLSGDYTSR